MKHFLVQLLLCLMVSPVVAQQATPDQLIFAYGSDIRPKFVSYVAELTGKVRPKVCYLPTASADHKDNIAYWEYICKTIDLDPYVLKVWVESSRTPQTFEDVLLGMDAIVVGGGNTLNMLGIWQAQGIDTVLHKALQRGIVLAGGSAGSLCWFETGTSDCRPVRLSMVEGLGFLPYSHSPHYAEEARKELYHRQLIDGTIRPGYACDDLSGVLFRNGHLVEAVSLNDVNHSYYVDVNEGQLRIDTLKSRLLVDKTALPEGRYTVQVVEKAVRDFPEKTDLSSPLQAFVSVAYLFANGHDGSYHTLASATLQDRLGTMTDKTPTEATRNNFLDMWISRVLTYEDSIAGVILPHRDFYGLWYFYREDGKWMSGGEDMGGATPLEAEIAFREKVPSLARKMHLDK